MKTLKLTLLIASVAFFSCCSSDNGSENFYCVQDGQFQRNDTPYYYVGTNFWYGPILASDTEGGDYARLTAELDSLKSIGISNLRVLVGGDGQPGLATRIEPTLQPEPGVYDERLFVGLDRFLNELNKRDMQAVLYLNNAWEWSGGYWQYLEWAGEGKAVIPAVDGWPLYMATAHKFIINDKAKALFADHIRTVVSRTNSVTGKAYKDDPAIFSWQIANEPRCFSQDDSIKTAFADWLWECAALIHSIDPNHMVSAGSEGSWGCEGDMALYEKIHSCPDIDYMTIHIWPYNWGWISQETVADSVAVAIRNTDAYINDHLVLAEKYAKPLVIEEFGYPRDGFRFEKSTPTDGRDAYYTHVFGRIAESSAAGGQLAGVNFWGWGGLADQSGTNIYWQKGDDYCGDPAQEEQGLNSVYMLDNSTIDVIRTAAEQLQPAE